MKNKTIIYDQLNDSNLFISRDEKFLFFENKVLDLRSGKFLTNNISEDIKSIIEIYKNDVKYLFENNQISNEVLYFSPRKFITIISESLKSYDDKFRLMLEWDRKYHTSKKIILENYSKNYIVEMVDAMFDQLFVLLTEQEQSLWDKTKSLAGSALEKTKEVGKKVGSAVVNQILSPLLKQGVIPLLRWIRKNAMTSIGIVVDVVTAMLPATSGINKLIWVLIVALDVYEIKMKDFDPQDPLRAQSPYMMMIPDLIALAFSAALGGPARIGAQAAIKGGVKKMPATTAKLFQKIQQTLPSIASSIKSFGNTLCKFKPICSIIKKIMGFVDSVISGVGSFLNQLFSKKGATAVATGLGVSALVWYTSKAPTLEVGKSGNDVLALNQYLSERNDYNFNPECEEIPDETLDGLRSSGNKYTIHTQNAVKQIQHCITTQPNDFKSAGLTKFQKPGSITGGAELIPFVNVEFDDRGVITKYIPEKNKKAASEKIKAVFTNSADLLAKALGEKKNLASKSM